MKLLPLVSPVLFVILPMQSAAVAELFPLSNLDSGVLDFEMHQVSRLLENAAEPDGVFRHKHDWVHADGHARRSLADKHAPAALMGDHVHEQGEVMVEYKYMNMYMEDNRVDSNTVSDTASIAIGGTFANLHPMGTNRGATPTDMTMEMHMIHLMYGLTDDVTVYTMIMLNSFTMDHIRGPANMTGGGPGSPFTTHNSGFGDTGFGALVRLSEKDGSDDLVLNLGFSVPTGDIFTTTSRPTAGMMSQPLPYPMRLGSGTFNARPGLTWKHYEENGSLGLQFQTDIPLGRNYRGYSVSDIYTLNAWYSHLVTDNFSISLRLENQWRTNFDGADPMTPPQIISTNVESFRGGYSLNLGLGAAALIGGHLFNVEIIPTLHQDLNGIQLETDWTMVASWSKSF